MDKTKQKSPSRCATEASYLNLAITHGEARYISNVEAIAVSYSALLIHESRRFATVLRTSKIAPGDFVTRGYPIRIKRHGQKKIKKPQSLCD